MIIRPMHTTDVPAAHVIRLAVRENRLSDPSEVQEQDYHDFLAGDTLSWVCVKDDVIAGFIMVDIAKQNLWALFVAPQQEGQGMGKVLHDTMLAAYWVRRDTLRLTTAPNTRAERFYRHAGYLDQGLTSNGKELIFELRRF